MDTTSLPLPPATRTTLQPGALLTLTAASGLRIEVGCGRLWLTEEGDADDHFIAAGEVHTVRGEGRVVIEVDCPMPVALTLVPASQPQAQVQAVATPSPVRAVRSNLEAIAAG